MHHSQVRHRRTNSALTAGLGILAEKYRLLSTECLRTLRVEIQLNAIYHLQVSISTEYSGLDGVHPYISSTNLLLELLLFWSSNLVSHSSNQRNLISISNNKWK